MNYKIGQKQIFSRYVTAEMIDQYSLLIGDSNPVHLDEAYAQKTMFKGRIAHGLLVAGFISTVLGNLLPGYGTIYLAQDLKFVKPVWIDDYITAEVEVVEIDNEKNRLTLLTRCYNQNQEDVIIGRAVVIPPKGE